MDKGIQIEVNDEQQSKQLSKRKDICSWREIEERDEHPKNIFVGREITRIGISIEFNDIQNSKQESPKKIFGREG